MILTIKQIKWLCIVHVLLLSAVTAHAQTKPKKATPIAFKKQELTRKFIAEGAAMGDVNKDWKKDNLSGAYWFEAPSWKAHELAKPDSFIVNGSYSDSFLDFAMDVNQDGWIDLI